MDTSVKEAGESLPAGVAELRAGIEVLFERLVELVGGGGGGEARAQELERELDACAASVYKQCDTLQQTLAGIKEAVESPSAPGAS